MINSTYLMINHQRSMVKLLVVYECGSTINIKTGHWVRNEAWDSLNEDRQVVSVRTSTERLQQSHSSY